MGVREEFTTKDDLEKSLGKFKEEIIHEFHVVSEGWMDHIKLLAEGHSGVVQRLDRVENRLDHMEKENERQHVETRALIKISFSELERRLSDLETQMKEMQEWRKQVQDRLQI
jgi:septal ring factor EnvC (AmiA/AmiB activator)